jgi:glycosyltransferase involved in cell wall biosynthesis
MKPLVSVIVPVYNTGAEAVALVDSLLNGSTYRNFEIILVDDGSTDDSLKTLQSIKARRVKVISKQNGGPSSARNFGIKNASGEYCVFVDSDDSVDATFLEKLVEEVLKPKTALAVTSVRYRKLALGTTEDVWMSAISRRKGESTKSLVLRCLLHDGRMYPVYNKIYKTEILRKKHLRFDESIHFGEDTKFTLDYLEHAKGEIRFILEPLYFYNFGTETSLATRGGVVWDNWLKCYRNLRNWLGDSISPLDRLRLFALKAKWKIGCVRMARRAKK